MFPYLEDTTIAALDLDPIKAKLIHAESGEGWTMERADAVELEYRRFLYLMKKYPDEITAPLVDVDMFWHYHILDTMKYAADCECVFGYFLHHFPYYGMRGEADSVAQAAAAKRMNDLYEQTFGTAQFAAAGTQAAYCIMTAKPAYCIMQSPESAYCIRTVDAYCIKTVDTAYCIITQSKPDARTTARPVYRERALNA